MAAKIFAVPVDVAQRPNYTGTGNFKEYQRMEADYVRAVQEYARKRYPNDPAAGMIYSFPVADGAAMYVVLCSRPLSLLWLDIGDAWQMPDVVRRGLRLSDVIPTQRKVTRG